MSMMGGLPKRRPDQGYDPPAPPGPVGGSAGTLRARLLIVFGPSGQFVGAFFYNPAPGAGNLVLSLAAVGGTDPYGNNYQPGVTSYGGSTAVFTQLSAGRIAFSDAGAVLRGFIQHALQGLTVFPSAASLTDLLPAILLNGVAAGGNPQVVIGSFTASGSPPSGTTAALLEVQGDIDIPTAGKGIRIATGANARMGSSTLAAGTVVVANTSVTASTQIYLNHHSIGPNAGVLGYVLNPGVGFTINSTNAADANSVVWLLVEPG